jgi:hypothetical protein
MLKLAVQEETTKRTQTYDRFSKLQSGMTSVNNTENSRHRSTSKMDENVARIKDMFMKTVTSQSAT